MPTNEDSSLMMKDRTSSVSPGAYTATYTYSPVTVYTKGAVATIFLGILAWISLIGWMRSETHYRAMKIQSEQLLSKRGD